MDELTYNELRDDALDREHDYEEEYEPTPREEALEDLERQTMERIIRDWQ